MPTDLTIVIPAKNEVENLRVLIPKVCRAMNALGVSYEVLVVDGQSQDATANVVLDLGARLIVQ